ncbi:DgyrCDS8806 [Dimorphilus gyrociliatus]|uniref:DgyrCDS8806 n=1 Tax=Dimorphilus gyrociliatus TaxID=2664684 RepID=A0A7I8VXK4_9ANNE|nr:DgyrCDS8806 [Dimorphilus gyrociliatus]
MSEENSIPLFLWDKAILKNKIRKIKVIHPPDLFSLYAVLHHLKESERRFVAYSLNTSGKNFQQTTKDDFYVKELKKLTNKYDEGEENLEDTFKPGSNVAIYTANLLKPKTAHELSKWKTAGKILTKQKRNKTIADITQEFLRRVAIKKNNEKNTETASVSSLDELNQLKAEKSIDRPTLNNEVISHINALNNIKPIYTNKKWAKGDFVDIGGRIKTNL